MSNGNGRMNYEAIGVVFAILLAVASAIGGYAVAKNNIENNKVAINRVVATSNANADKTQVNKESIIKINGKLDNISTKQVELKNAVDKQNEKLEEILRKLD